MTDIGDALALPSIAPARRLVDTVHTALRDAILQGGIDPGSALSVPELSRRLNVSRSPVREAVLQLVADGLAVETPRRGVVVKEIAAEDLRQIHEIREVLEGLAARRAAERGDASLKERLALVLTEQAAAIAADDGKGFYETDRRFHQAIAEAAGNPRLAQMQVSLRAEMSLALIRVAASPGHARSALDEHQSIAHSIADGDGDRAEAAMKRHIQATRRRSHEGGLGG